MSLNACKTTKGSLAICQWPIHSLKKLNWFWLNVRSHKCAADECGHISYFPFMIQFNGKLRNHQSEMLKKALNKLRVAFLSCSPALLVVHSFAEWRDKSLYVFMDGTFWCCWYNLHCHPSERLMKSNHAEWWKKVNLLNAWKHIFGKRFFIVLQQFSILAVVKYERLWLIDFCLWPRLNYC